MLGIGLLRPPLEVASAPKETFPSRYNLATATLLLPIGFFRYVSRIKAALLCKASFLRLRLLLRSPHTSNFMVS
jgi:hypothetical protein